MLWSAVHLALDAHFLELFLYLGANDVEEALPLATLCVDGLAYILILRLEQIFHCQVLKLALEE